MLGKGHGGLNNASTKEERKMSKFDLVLMKKIQQQQERESKGISIAK